MEVIEVQYFWSWRLTITSISTRSGRHRRADQPDLHAPGSPSSKPNRPTRSAAMRAVPQARTDHGE